MVMVTLRTRMQTHLARDWRDDLDPLWRTFFADVEPDLDFETVPGTLQIDDEAPVWPGRRGVVNPRAPAGAHICRAFDGIAPGDVRVVVLGRDPYPEMAQATGRAFEDGAWTGTTKQLATSLKPLMLAALATRVGHEDLFAVRKWPEVRRQIADDSLTFPALRDYFDTLAGRGVLFVNAAWTHTRDNDFTDHLKLWKPVVDHMLKKLAGNDQPVVFLILGEDARKTFCAAEPICNRSAIVDNAHPARYHFYNRRNPLTRVNAALADLGVPEQEQITWWPPRAQNPA